jgi:FkbM family methyltransferase
MKLNFVLLLLSILVVLNVINMVNNKSAISRIAHSVDLSEGFTRGEVISSSRDTVSAIVKSNIFGPSHELQDPKTGDKFYGRLGITIHREPIVIDPTDLSISNTIVTQNTWADDARIMFKDLVRENDVVMHIGGQIGYFETLLSQLVGKSGEVHVVEASSHWYKFINYNVALNHLDNVNTYQFGVGEVDNVSRDLCYRPYVSVVYSFIPDMFSFFEAVSCEKVSMHTLDSYFKNLKKIDFLFIDVEGYEIKVLNGAEDLLARSNNPTFLIKWYPGWAEDMPDVNAFLQGELKSMLDQGYKVYKMHYPTKDESGVYVEVNLDSTRELERQYIVLIHKSKRMLKDEKEESYRVIPLGSERALRLEHE